MGGLAALSPRERAIYELYSQGIGPGDIARQLYRSPKTVYVHLERIAEKLGYPSVKEWRRSFFRVVTPDARRDELIAALRQAQQVINDALARYGA